MIGFIIFLSAYAAATVVFFIALLRWTIRKERGCACGGAFELVTFVHTPKMCYPMAESLTHFSK